ncbi:MAG TPA: M20/M25/M40 family metallo-hydrolase [Actinobacteria bacterium]|nr:M20/M25/M40 family metallo-hydrolase [Actinomycetota bacterium]
MDELVDELARLVAIPSVSAPGFPAEEVRRSAETVAERFADAGAAETRLLEAPDMHPAVYAAFPGPPEAPTVLLYAHHDVQPPGPLEAWETPPFRATIRGGRIHGRGTADDKNGIVTHLGVVRAFGGHPPVTVKVLVEGEEEIGSPNLGRLLDDHGDLLAADVVVVADSANWRRGVPALTTSLRGLVDCLVEVRTLRAGIHSGLFGGPVPDALTVLVRLLASLHDEHGDVTVPGLVAGDADPLDLDEDELRAQAGTVAGLRLLGEGALTARLWRRPAASILAVDAPRTDEAINQLVPVARAKVSLRLAPGDDPDRAMESLVRHLEAATPWGAEVTVTPGARGRPFEAAPDGPGHRAFTAAMTAAYGTPPVEIGMGGSIPLVAALEEHLPAAEILLVGAADPTSNLHGPDESQDLEDLRRATLAEALALDALA